MPEINADTIAASRSAADLVPDQMPRSVAIIMDGNGRWGRAQGLPRSAGHRAGGETVRRIVIAGAALGLEAMTLYSFSIENWARPREEVELLMELYAEYLRGERATLVDHNIQLRHLGRRDGLPQRVLDELDETVTACQDNTGMTLCLALNYGSRAEITDAVRSIARRAADGQLAPDAVDESVISDSLYTSGVRDPDLVIRTAGEVRLSNFLLWQVSYAELYVTDVFWPDFREEHFHDALRSFAHRHRRFGGVDDSNT